MKPMMMLALLLALPATVHAFDYQEKADQLLTRMDHNKDGIVSKDEFLRPALLRFNKMDADGNGELTHEEIRAYWRVRQQQFEAWKKKSLERND